MGKITRGLQMFCIIQINSIRKVKRISIYKIVRSAGKTKRIELFIRRKLDFNGLGGSTD